MLKFLLSALSIAIGGYVYGQAGITKDGKYVFVSEDKSKNQTGSTLVIQSTFDSWKKEIKNAYAAKFLDNRHVQFNLADSVFTLELSTANQSGIAKSDIVTAKAVSVADLLPETILTEFTFNTDPVIASSGGIKAFVSTESGKTILFYLQEKSTPKIPDNYVDIWSYTDGKNQDAQLRDAEIPRKYAFCFNKETSKLIRLEGENEKLAARYAGYVSQYQLNDNYAIVYHFTDDIFTYERNGIINEGYSLVQYNWNSKTDCNIYLISLKDDTRKLIKENAIPISGNLPRYWLSPDSKYVLYAEEGNYYSYEIDNGVRRKLATVSNSEADKTGLFLSSDLYQWLPDDFILVKDSYSDLWKISLSNKTTPVNITNGFFKRTASEKDAKILRFSPIQVSGNRIVCRISCANQYLNDGIYTINLEKNSDPKPLIGMNTAYQYDFFQKAESKEVYLVRRQNAQEPPKYFYTMDFKKFDPVTGSDPDERPEGIKTEVIAWKSSDGKSSQGVLYKPRDFDPSKKYPIIFVYYESKNQPHNFYVPYGVGDLVDYGYLVFSPDIFYTLGETGKSAMDAVVSAAEFLSEKQWVDRTRMGLRGGSFGGFETNFIITHTNMFTAAISGAGYSDFISNMGSLDNGRRPHSLEGGGGQNRLGVTMWERPDLWIKNSPLFYADKVSTPLLIVHSMTDDNIPFEQNVAFFKALRYFGKRVWMLQYDNGGHIGGNFSKSIVGKNDGNCDMCTRQLQFFNHYLKGEPAPKWMLNGIPARLKGIEKGLELDTTGRTPGPGLVRDKTVITSQQEKLLENRRMVTDEGTIVKQF